MSIQTFCSNLSPKYFRKVSNSRSNYKYFNFSNVLDFHISLQLQEHTHANRQACFTSYFLERIVDC